MLFRPFGRAPAPPDPLGWELPPPVLRLSDDNMQNLLEATSMAMQTGHYPRDYWGQYGFGCTSACLFFKRVPPMIFSNLRVLNCMSKLIMLSSAVDSEAPPSPKNGWYFATIAK